MRVLLNTTEREVRVLGGDFTHYRAWMRLDGMHGLEIRSLDSSTLRAAVLLARTAIEKSVRSWQPDGLRRTLFLLSRLVWTRPPLHGDLLFSNLLFPFFTEGLPVVWNSQGISPPEYYERTGEWNVEDVAFVYRVLGSKAAALTITTEWCARNLVRFCPELKAKVHVVPPPLFVEHDDAHIKPSLRDGMLRFLFVGIDAERKGLPELVAAWRQAAAGKHDVQLRVVSRPLGLLRRDVISLPKTVIQESGPDVDVYSLMANADVFVLPTRADTYALALAEAMAHGCAVITTDLDPLPEVVAEGRVGRCVRVGDVEGLASLLAHAMNDESDVRRRQREAKLVYRERHAPPAVAERLARVFDGVLRDG